MPVGVVCASEVVPQLIQTGKQMVQSQSDFDDDSVCQGPDLEVVTCLNSFFFQQEVSNILHGNVSL